MKFASDTGRPIPEPKEYSFKDWPTDHERLCNFLISWLDKRQDLHDGTGGFSPSNRPLTAKLDPVYVFYALLLDVKTWSIDAGWAEMLLVLSYSSILWNVYHSILISHHVCIIFAMFIALPSHHALRCTGAFWTALQPRSRRHLGLRNAGRVAARATRRLWRMTWRSRRKFGSWNVGTWKKWLEIHR